MEMSKYLAWNDALKIMKKSLDETIAESKGNNTAYQKYLLSNPYSKRKKELQLKKKDLIEKIIKLSGINPDDWNGKV